MRGMIVNAVVFVLASFMPAGCLTSARADEVRWQKDGASASAEARRLNRPLFVLVTSKGCGWCRMLESSTLRDPAVVQLLNSETIPIRIDADDPAAADFLAALEVEGLPTSAIIGPDRRLRRKLSGYRDPSAFLDWLQLSRGR